MGLRAHHFYLFLLIVIIASNIIYVFQNQNLKDRALETQGRIIDADAGRGVWNIAQYVDQRTGNVYVLEGVGRYRSPGEMVNVLYDPERPSNAILEGWDVWDLPRVSIIPVTFFTLLTVLSRRSKHVYM
jgi:hypothetical protein